MGHFLVAGKCAFLSRFEFFDSVNLHFCIEEKQNKSYCQIRENTAKAFSFSLKIPCCYCFEWEKDYQKSYLQKNLIAVLYFYKSFLIMTNLS